MDKSKCPSMFNFKNKACRPLTLTLIAPCFFVILSDFVSLSSTRVLRGSHLLLRSINFINCSTTKTSLPENLKLRENKIVEKIQNNQHHFKEENKRLTLAFNFWKELLKIYIFIQYLYFQALTFKQILRSIFSVLYCCK